MSRITREVGNLLKERSEIFFKDRDELMKNDESIGGTDDGQEHIIFRVTRSDVTEEVHNQG